jgi:uncharacterized protein YndB with AHSA1/START domain
VTEEHAVLLQREGKAVLRFERRLRHSPERVWAALTERGELDGWHPTPFELRGEEIVYPGEHDPPMRPGRVLACEPPRLLAHTWGEDELHWKLQETDDGCLLELEHVFEDRFKAARDGAGWHLCLLTLRGRLDGAAAPRPGEGMVDQRLPDRWAELNQEYQQRFGISPEQATPVPPA